MAKATHKGTCQICGHFQKLPNGELSKHGYTKRWGFFDGVCTGAHNKPFEESFGLIQYSVDNVKRMIAAAEKNASDIAEQTDVIYASVYRSATWERRQSYYEEVVLQVADITFTKYGDFVFVDPKTGKPVKIELHASYDERNRGVAYIFANEGFEYIKEGCVKLANRKKVKGIEHKIAQMQEYVKWQEGRIANWKPGKLTEVEA